MLPNVAGNAAIAVAMVLAIAVVLMALAARLTRLRNGRRPGGARPIQPPPAPEDRPGDPRP